MATWFYCAEVTGTNLQGYPYTYKKDGTITSDDFNLHSVDDVINHIKDSHVPKTEMGNAIGTVVLIAFNKV
ncbi:hypothetical protein BS639_24510 [Rouxiella silvae]|uniref:Uncharacterized protein n=1 Tax=Rouxiella silvae TaxID=1646373 RepID=A0ABX3TTP6_9GAMM|nr:hypothetical protein [Rouxiella silvae]ORJ18590.1 hypothetical protein BS639_24510 [Rouxiella silvae]